MLQMRLAAGFAAAALMTTAVVAQTSAPTAPAGQGQIMTQMPPDLMRGSKLMGIDVYGADNQKIGDIDEVLVDRQGKIQGIVVGVGGFLGIGQKDIAIPYDQVQWMSNQEVQAQNNQGGGAAGGAGGGAGGTGATTGNTAGGAGGGAGGTTASTSSTLGGAGGAGGTATSGAGGSTGAPAGAGGAAGTSAAGGTGGDANMPARAMVRMTKADLQNAPEFRYNANQGNQSGGGGAGGAGGGAGGGATGGAGGGAGGAGGITAPRP